MACVPFSAGVPNLTLRLIGLDGELPGVSITLTRLDQEAPVRTGVSGATGKFTATVPPGRWEVTCRLFGFAPVRTHLTISAGVTCDGTITLELLPQTTVT